MKKWLSCLFSCGCVVLLLFGCSRESAVSTEQVKGKIFILSTTGVIDDLIQMIVEDKIAHAALIQGEIDPHSYELVKGDDEKIGQAHLFVYNGLGLEHGLSIQAAIKRHNRTLGIGEEIVQQAAGKILQTGGQIDPHIWMDASLWVLSVKPLVEAICSLDPENSDFYIAQGKEAEKKLLSLHQYIQKKMEAVPEARRYLVTTHDAFSYFAKAYLTKAEDWKERAQAPEGLAPEGQLSFFDIQRLVNHILDHKISVIFAESNLNQDSLDKIVDICRNKGVKVEVSSSKLYGDTLFPKKEADEEKSLYIKTMKHNVDMITYAWTG